MIEGRSQQCGGAIVVRHSFLYCGISFSICRAIGHEIIACVFSYAKPNYVSEIPSCPISLTRTLFGLPQEEINIEEINTVPSSNAAKSHDSGGTGGDGLSHGRTERRNSGTGGDAHGSEDYHELLPAY